MRNGNNRPLHARAGQQTGFPSTAGQPGHRDRFGAAWNMAGSGQRMIVGGWGGEGWGGGRLFSGREPRLFLFLKKRYPTFVPRENEISIKTGHTGNFVSAWFLLL